METCYTFELPKGYHASDGKLHRTGSLRLATAGDEVAVLGDPRVKANRAYAVILLLSRVVLRLGDLEGDDVTPEVIEGLFSADLAYLHELYREINGEGTLARTCPHCGGDISSLRVSPTKSER